MKERKKERKKEESYHQANSMQLPAIGEGGKGNNDNWNRGQFLGVGSLFTFEHFQLQLLQLDTYDTVGF